MKKFKIYYGLGVCNAKWDDEIHEFENKEQALDYAYAMVCEEYDAIAINDDGYRSLETIMEEDGLTETEAQEQYENERMDNIEYDAEELQGN